jgi:hypothetical protein
MKNLFGILLLSLALTVAGFAKPVQVKRITPGSSGTVLLFVSSQCPCTDAHRGIVNRLLDTARPQGITFYCIFSNAGETPELVNYFFRNIGWDMPYLLDLNEKLADRYHATNTPEAMVLGTDGALLFRGPIDDSAKNQGRVDRAYLPEAIDDVLAGRAIRSPEIPPAGCWIVRRSEMKTASGS